MGIADMDFRAAPAITKALQDRLQHENWGYLDMTAHFQQITTQVVAWNKKRHDVDINPEHRSLSHRRPSGTHRRAADVLPARQQGAAADADLQRLLLRPPAHGTNAEESPLKLVNGRYSMDFEDFERRIGHDTNTFILCNPQNPTGNCWSQET